MCEGYTVHAMCDEVGVAHVTILIGGCCRTTTESIRALRHAVDEYKEATL